MFVFLTQFSCKMFWTSLVLRLELLPFDFSLGFILFELFSQTYLGRRVELTTFLIVNLLCFYNANMQESRARARRKLCVVIMEALHS